MACALGQGAPPAEEHDPFAPVTGPARIVRTQVECIEMSHDHLTRLLMEDKVKTADATELRKSVQELVGKDEAQLLDTQIVTGRSGERSLTESRQEFIYPTEFNTEALNERIKRDLEEAMASPFSFNPATPTAFEYRHLGSEFECEPVVGDDIRFVDVRIQSEFLWHTGNTLWHEGKDSAGNAFKITMPDFYAIEISTSVTCVSGQYVLLGALSPKDAKGAVNHGRKVMVFLKCDVLTLEP
jgi:hypothetical protein